jgi:hypothetical protein
MLFPKQRMPWEAYLNGGESPLGERLKGETAVYSRPAVDPLNSNVLIRLPAEISPKYLGGLTRIGEK